MTVTLDHPTLANMLADADCPPEVVVDWLLEERCELPDVLLLYAGTAPFFQDGIGDAVLFSFCRQTGVKYVQHRVEMTVNPHAAVVRVRPCSDQEAFALVTMGIDHRQAPFPLRSRSVTVANTQAQWDHAVKDGAGKAVREAKRRTLKRFGDVRWYVRHADLRGPAIDMIALGANIKVVRDRQGRSDDNALFLRTDAPLYSVNVTTHLKAKNILWDGRHVLTATACGDGTVRVWQHLHAPDLIPPESRATSPGEILPPTEEGDYSRATR